MIKFILQPIVENYFVHGIRRQDQDNRIFLKVRQKEEEIFFQITDNGIGIADSAVQKKNQELEQNDYRETQSVGIENVNRRIKSVYGNEYGVTLYHGEGRGLSVMIRVGMEKSE